MQDLKESFWSLACRASMERMLVLQKLGLEALALQTRKLLNHIRHVSADMVGHTGDLKATAHACHLVDKCLKELLDVCEEQGGRWLVTADHGNADDMVQRSKKDQQPIKVDGKLAPLTSHTLVSSHVHYIYLV